MRRPITSRRVRVARDLRGSLRRLRKRRADGDTRRGMVRVPMQCLCTCRQEDLAARMLLVPSGPSWAGSPRRSLACGNESRGPCEDDAAVALPRWGGCDGSEAHSPVAAGTGSGAAARA
jgi:hypothetical protein